MNKGGEEMKLLLENNPEEIAYVFSVVNSLIQKKKLDLASKILEDIESMYPLHPDLLIFRCRFAMLENKIDDYLKYINLIIPNNFIEVAKKLEILIPLVSIDIPFSEKQKILSSLLNKYPDLPESNTLYAGFLYFNDKPVEAREYYLKALSNNNNLFDVWEQIISIDWNLNDMDRCHCSWIYGYRLFSSTTYFLFIRRNCL